MSYIRQEFIDGKTTLSAEHLKKLENAIIDAETAGVYLGFLLSQDSPPIFSDCNDIPTGWCWASLWDGQTSIANAPDNSILRVGILESKICEISEQIYGSQKFTDVYNGAPVTYERGCVAGVWSEWYLSQSSGGSSSSEQPFAGCKCVAFGNSLTAYDPGYVKPLASLMGATIDRQAVGGAAIAGATKWTSKTILNFVEDYTNWSDKDICFLQGFVNDWGTDKPVGELTDTGTDTVCGAIKKAIEIIYTKKPTIQLIGILDHTGGTPESYNDSNYDAAALKQNGNGITQLEFYTKIKQVFEMYGIPTCDQYKDSGIGEMTPRFRRDFIHLSEAGGQQDANTIYRKMLLIGREAQ